MIYSICAHVFWATIKCKYYDWNRELRLAGLQNYFAFAYFRTVKARYTFIHVQFTYLFMFDNNFHSVGLTGAVSFVIIELRTIHLCVRQAFLVFRHVRECALILRRGIYIFCRSHIWPCPLRGSYPLPPLNVFFRFLYEFNAYLVDIGGLIENNI